MRKAAFEVADHRVGPCRQFERRQDEARGRALADARDGPVAGKRGGGYSNGVYDTPPYILLNWADQLGDTFTLAHELGHSMHSYLTVGNQPYVYGDYPIFTAEVASTFNELLLMDLLLRRAEDDRQRKLFLLDYHLSQINNTVFRQTMFAEFEHRIHQQGEQGQTLTADSLGELAEAKIVTRDEDGNWLLARDFSSLSLGDLYQLGGYYLPLGEIGQLPRDSAWDRAYIAALQLIREESHGVWDQPLEDLYSDNHETRSTS